MTSKFKRGGGGQATNNPDISSILQALADEERRHILYYLVEESDGVADLDEVIRLFDSVPTRSSMEKLSTWMPEAQLYHQHFPRMEEAGIIEFDPQSETVRYRENELLESIMGLVAPHDFTGTN